MGKQNALTSLRSRYLGDGLYDPVYTIEQYRQLSNVDRVAFKG
jgi:hypothetical protein